MRGEVFIDLGELIEVDDDAGADAPQSRPKWRVPAWASAALVVLAVLAVVAGPPPRPRVVRIADFPGIERGFMLLDGGFVRQDGGELFFVGADGRERWRIPWQETVNDDMQDGVIGGRLLFRIQRAGGDVQTIALDVATGEQLWQLDGWAFDLGDVVMEWGDEGLRIHDPGDGRLLWESRDHRAAQPDPRTRSMFILDRDQRMTERDLRTGEVRRSQQLVLPAELDQLDIQTGEEYLMVAAFSMAGQRHELVYLSRPELRLLQAPPVRYDYRYDCGAVDCVLRFGGGGEAGGVVDRATNRLLWSVDEGQIVLPWEGGRLMLTGFTQSPSEVRALEIVDPVTRRSLVDVTGWTLLADPGGRSAPAEGVSRIALFRGQGRPTLVAHMGSHGPRVLGSIPGDVTDCRYVAPLVLCRATRNTIGVWRVDA